VKRFGASQGLDRAAWAKQYRFLAQRGFSADQIQVALSTQDEP
jgi:SOS response regulatory protein OraA/RecX